MQRDLTDDQIMSLALAAGLSHQFIPDDYADAVGIPRGRRHTINDVTPETTLSFARVVEAQVRAALASAPAAAEPIDMVLYCPNCGKQHIDSIETTPAWGVEPVVWDNPPHRSHLCHSCGCIWRPADVPTNGVAAITTKGKADTWVGKAPFAAPAAPTQDTAPWPFVLAPGLVASWLSDALHEYNGDMLAAVRYVFIEQGVPLRAAKAPVAQPAAGAVTIYMDAGDLRQVLNGNDMPAWSSACEARGTVRLTTHPAQPAEQAGEDAP